MGIFERIKNIEEGDYCSRANLHSHSTYSDGKESFESLIQQAQELGLEHFAISDHNTVAGYLNNEYKKYDFLIPAVEFDCVMDFVLLHILGYGIDPECQELQGFCAKSKAQTAGDLTRLIYSRSPKQIIDAIHSAGGVAILAHPCCCWAISLKRFIQKLKDIGLDGVEVYYPYDRFRGVLKFHSKKSAHKVTEELGLLKTGGLDSHGKLEERTGRRSE